MKLSSMFKRQILFLLVFLLAIKSKGQTTGISPAGLLCISECGTCPVICSPPPSPTTPTLLPPSSPPPQHHSPPQFEFVSPPPLSTPSRPPPSPRQFDYIYPPPLSTPSRPRPPPPSSSSSTAATPPPPSGFVYTTPGVTVSPQRNFTYPYYYFYTSKASCSLPLHQGFVLFMLFRFLQVFLGL